MACMAGTLLCSIVIISCGFVQTRDPATAASPNFIPYSADCPNLLCLPDRVLVEADSRLSPTQRAALWREYGLLPTFDWVEAADGWDYHELDVRQWSIAERLLAALSRRELPSRELPALIAALSEDPRIHWAAPDALLLEWADSGSEEQAQRPAAAREAAVLKSTADKPAAAADAANPARGASFADANLRPLAGGLRAWESLDEATRALCVPLPDFEYYRECLPDGSAVNWDSQLASSPLFAAGCARVYGTGQQAALQAWQRAGAEPFSTITVCVADTGVLLNHPDLAGRLHPNALDCNYRSYSIGAAEERADPNDRISDRESPRAIGLPRAAIKERPASHGTCVAGVVARCTAGFEGRTGDDAVRILPASIKSERVFALTGTRVKSPLSAFVKLIASLRRDFPTGLLAPVPGQPLQNSGDVRVVNVSAAIPRSYFSGREWRVVAPVVSKAEGSIAQDLRHNDRLYVFAAGNERQSEPSRPGNEDYVMSVSAAMPFDGSRAWDSPHSGEGSNMGLKCVSAPGYGVITSTLYNCPNLDYLDPQEIPQSSPSFSVPPRSEPWHRRTNRFSATSSATPQVSALAALLYAQEPGLSYPDVMHRIVDSTAGRRTKSDYGESQGLIDFRRALGLGQAPEIRKQP